jgi:hypothetical protein
VCKEATNELSSDRNAKRLTDDPRGTCCVVQVITLRKLFDVSPSFQYLRKAFESPTQRPAAITSAISAPQRAAHFTTLRRMNASYSRKCAWYSLPHPACGILRVLSKIEESILTKFGPETTTWGVRHVAWRRARRLGGPHVTPRTRLRERACGWIAWCACGEMSEDFSNF